MNINPRSVCECLLKITTFCVFASNPGYIEVPLRWGVTPVGRVTKGEVVSHDRVACSEVAPEGSTSQGRGITFGSRGTSIIFLGVCNHLRSYALSKTPVFG